MNGIYITDVLARGGGARMSIGLALTYIHIVVVRNAHKTDLSSDVLIFVLLVFFMVFFFFCLLSVLQYVHDYYRYCMNRGGLK